MNKKQSILFLTCLLALQLVFAQTNPPFWNEIQAFKKTDSLNPPPKKVIVFTGSSTFRLWPDLEHSFKGRLPILNRGFGGSTLPDMIRYEQDVMFNYKPAQVVIYCGDNDLASSDTVTANLVFNRFVQLFNDIRKALPNTSLLFVSIKPSPSRWHLKDKMIEANSLIKKFLDGQKKAFFVSIWNEMLDAEGKPNKTLFKEDNLHMNANGYAIWSGVLTPYLLRK